MYSIAQTIFTVIFVDGKEKIELVFDISQQHSNKKVSIYV